MPTTGLRETSRVLRRAFTRSTACPRSNVPAACCTFNSRESRLHQVSMESNSPTQLPRAPQFLRCALPGFLCIYGALWFLISVYHTFRGPLSSCRGPTLNAFSIVPFLKAVYSGDEEHYTQVLHENYGSAVRIGPNTLSFATTSQRWKNIHGFQKAGRQLPQKDSPFYSLPVNRVPNIINGNDNIHARQRKTISQAFSEGGLKEQEPLLNDGFC